MTVQYYDWEGMLYRVTTMPHGQTQTECFRPGEGFVPVRAPSVEWQAVVLSPAKAEAWLRRAQETSAD